jgi:DNA-binding CsgD family transcriptional regulator
MARLLDGDDDGARADLERGIVLMRRLQGSGPAHYRGLWPLLLAVAGDPRAPDAIAQERDAGMTVNRGNRGLLALAKAVLTGRDDPERATRIAADADADLVHYPVWSDLARLQAAPRALADRWGQPRRWLAAGHDTFAARGLDELAARCALLLDGPVPNAFGLTAREAEVLAGVADGLANKEIAAALAISPRTVEKHIESILRKSGARSRTHLVALAGGRPAGSST